MHGGGDFISDFISIIVAVKNEEKYIEKCLNSLVNQDFPHDFYQIVVVDGMSTDQTLNIVKNYVREYPRLIKLYENSKEWQAAGRNLAIKLEEKTNLFAYIDGHCIADNEWLKSLYSSYKEMNNYKVGGIGSVHRSPEDELPFGKAVEQVFCSLIGGLGSSYKPANQRKEVNTAPFVLYKREALEKVGFYDEDMRYGEDFTLNFKLRKAGYNLFVDPKAIVYYYKRNSLFSFSKQMYNYGVTKAIIRRKYPSAISILHYIPSISIVFLIILIIISFFLEKVILLVFFMLLYLSVVYFSTFMSAIAKKQWGFIGIMPEIYITEHFAFGIGFLLGLAKKGW